VGQHVKVGIDQAALKGTGDNLPDDNSSLRIPGPNLRVAGSVNADSDR
jgi:hypothetical protein